MGSRTKQTVLLYSLMVLSTLWSDVATQILNTKGASTFQSPAFQSQSQSAFLPVSTKGYNSAQRLGGLGYYNNLPVNAAYWTGQFAQGQYPQSYYPQYQHQMYNPYPNQYFPQPYGYAHHSTGFAQSYGHYPNFDANYWMMSHPRGHAYNQYYRHPMYYPGQYYPGGHSMYGGQYVYGHPGQYPYYKKPFGAGLLSGKSGHFVKGLVGGLVVASLAKKIG